MFDGWSASTTINRSSAWDWISPTFAKGDVGKELRRMKMTKLSLMLLGVKTDRSGNVLSTFQPEKMQSGTT